MSGSAKSGVINLAGVYEAIAQRLIVALAEGRILHKTKNIADSGQPLEIEFRKFLDGRLPDPFFVHHGYLYDTESDCTPQIDVIISDKEQSTTTLQTEGGCYVYAVYIGIRHWRD